MSDDQNIKQNYKWILNIANQKVQMSIDAKDIREIQKHRMDAIKIFHKVLDNLDVREYLLLDSNPEIPESVIYDSLFKLGTLYKSYVETEIQNDVILHRQNEANRKKNPGEFKAELQAMFREALKWFNIILKIRFEDNLALQQITSVYTHMSLLANDIDASLGYMQEALLYVPGNPTIHYNLGYIYQRLNRLEVSLIHYKLSFDLIKADKTETRREEYRKLSINNLNGISSIFRSLKNWPEALHYLLKAECIDGLDPDIQNQLGIVYTEMRRTDLAEVSYNRAIQNYKRAFISTDHTFLLSELYLNLGHMHSYNGDNYKSVDCYNKSLQTCPKFNLPFQNKIMNLNYLFNELDDKMYITNQHKLVNKLYKRSNINFVFDKEFYNTQQINIGIISGDFVDHPVSFFISTFLKNFDNKRFTVTCYSECIINTGLYNKNLRFTTIKNLSAEAAAKIIYNDKIQILFDLAGHTAFNRLDVFALKPSPIQITYIGYPFTTGLNEMDYRITDNICDGDFSVSQKFYTERLIAMKNCFLCYDPEVVSSGSFGNVESDYIINHRKRDGYINIGCFNRTNKITNDVIKMFNGILERCENVRLIFKTKALINKVVRENFIKQFKENFRDRIIVLDCTLTHKEHILTYNEIDIAIDTFPYSGTTTTCEALWMGVPVYSVYDSENYFHAQNVSCSILKNSGLQEYIIYKQQDVYEKIKNLQQFKDDQNFWKDLKVITSTKFKSGLVCNKQEYIKNFENLLNKLFNDKNTFS